MIRAIFRRRRCWASVLRCERFSEASNYLRIAAKSDPTNLELHRVLAKAACGLRSTLVLWTSSSSFLQQNPDSCGAYAEREALDGLGEHAEAIDRISGRS